MGRIIVIDGTSNAGKTSLCENLQKNISNVVIIPGASAFAKEHKEKYSKIPLIPKNIEEEKENQKFFFKLELDRLIEANNAAKQGKDVFMDRGVLEILSVAYSFESIKNWGGIYENAVNLYKRFIKIADESKICLPNKHICLQADSDEILRRNTIRGIERGQTLFEKDWIETSLINRQIEFFNMLCTPQNRDKIHIIDTSHMTKQEVLTSTCDLLKLKFKEIGERE